MFSGSLIGIYNLYVAMTVIIFRSRLYLYYIAIMSCVRLNGLIRGVELTNFGEDSAHTHVKVKAISILNKYFYQSIYIYA